MVAHSSILAWKIPWMADPGGLQSRGSLGVGHNWVTSLSCIGEGNGNPLQCSCLENPRDGGAWWAAICGVAQSRTWLKRLSSSSKLTTLCQFLVYSKMVVIHMSVSVLFQILFPLRFLQNIEQHSLLVICFKHRACTCWKNFSLRFQNPFLPW